MYKGEYGHPDHAEADLDRIGELMAGVTPWRKTREAQR